jgi:putative ABC transport system ATP-binding protein
MSLLVVDHVTQTYTSASRSLDVLKDVSFTVEPGTTNAIVGPSGSGKTTLLSLCAGLDRATRGHVMFAGHDLGLLDEDELAAWRSREVGFVFQSFRLLPTLTALENVMTTLELRGTPAKEARRLAAEQLEQVGLKDRLDHHAIQLSGGEQQRVALARAFVHRPRILFADEPTGNLDGATSRAVADLLFALHANAGTTLVLVTHDLTLAQRTSRILELADGRIAHDRVVEAAAS